MARQSLMWLTTIREPTQSTEARAMSLPYQRILCPIDFDDNSIAALGTAADLARRSDGTVYVLHVVPMIVQPTAMPVYVDIYKSQEETAWARLKDLARKDL